MPSALRLLEGCCCMFHPQGESIRFYTLQALLEWGKGGGLHPLGNRIVFLKWQWQWEAGKSGTQGPKVEIRAQWGN